MLLNHVFGIKLPADNRIRLGPTDVQVLVPHTYHADCTLLIHDADDHPVFGVVMEVQRGWDDDKRRTWKLYVAQMETQFDIDFILLVYCPDQNIARRYGEMFQHHLYSLPLRPFIYTPADVPMVVDVQEARAEPDLTVLSAVCHASFDDVDTMFPALKEALSCFDTAEALRYYDMMLLGLPPAVRTRWEEFMTTAAPEYHSELFRELATQHEELGRALGEAEAVLTVLEGRGVAVPQAIRAEILACTDLAQLRTWLLRASTATTADDLIG